VLWIVFLIPLVVVLAIVIVGSLSGEPSSDIEAGPAPGFSLPTTAGGLVSLDEILSGGDDALLYFSMGVGCDGCFTQIPEAIDGLAARGVNLVPVMVDPPGQVMTEAGRFAIGTPILIDEDRRVSEAYGMLGIYGHSDRPSHSFALVRSDGTVGWVKHYPTMFVPVEQLLVDMGLA
jgi:peroxiredoxin